MGLRLIQAPAKLLHAGYIQMNHMVSMKTSPTYLHRAGSEMCATILYNIPVQTAVFYVKLWFLHEQQTFGYRNSRQNCEAMSESYAPVEMRAFYPVPLQNLLG